MRKLLLLSLMLVTFALPMYAARDRSAIRGLRRVLSGTALFVVLYVLALIYVFPHLS